MTTTPPAGAPGAERPTVIDDVTNDVRALSKASAASFLDLEDRLPDNAAAPDAEVPRDPVPLPDPRVAARAAVEKACADRYDGPSRCWRPTFVAAVLTDLALILPIDMRAPLYAAAQRLRETADYELEEAWPK